MKLRKEERIQRRSLTLLFAGVVFFILLCVILIVGGTLYVLMKNGVIAEEGMVNGSLVVGLMVLISIILGAMMSFFLGRYVLRPVNRIINGMNRLASGDFRARISFPGIWQKHPTLRELSDSFNAMASELENTEVLREDFINNFSHEFKTPIVSIAGFAKLLRRGNLSQAETQEYLAIIEDESLRLSAMATNILNLTNVENQTILTDVTRFNLSEQLRDCVLLLENKWERKNLELELDFQERFISANAELLKQIWLNLLDNAVKFTPEGGTVGVEISESQDRVSVSVRNTGSEIPPEAHERVFRKFYQADTSHAGEGNGIGLAIVKRVTELHGGTVTADGGDGWTRFTVELPKAAQL